MFAAWQQAGLEAERLVGVAYRSLVMELGDGADIWGRNLGGDLSEFKRDLDINFNNGGLIPGLSNVIVSCC